MLLVLSENSYRIIVLGRMPNVHLIPSRNANDQTNISATFPSLLHSPLRNMITHFHAVTHLPSSPKSPSPSESSLGKTSSHWKIQNHGIYPPQSHHSCHIMLMTINEHYWQPIPHNGHSLDVFNQHITTCSNFFICCYQFLYFISTTQLGMCMHSYSEHIISSRFK